jgi:hypothetical protein
MVMRVITLAISSLLICATAAFGEQTIVAKCRQSPMGCYEQAAKDCKGGSYQVLDSDSHAGGLLTDDLWAGPFIWYAMSYACGPSDGRLADFSFVGPRPRH